MINMIKFRYEYHKTAAKLLPLCLFFITHWAQTGSNRHLNPFCEYAMIFWQNTVWQCTGVTLAQVFSSEFCEIFKSTSFDRTLLVVASGSSPLAISNSKRINQLLFHWNHEKTYNLLMISGEIGVINFLNS